MHVWKPPRSTGQWIAPTVRNSRRAVNPLAAFYAPPPRLTAWRRFVFGPKAHATDALQSLAGFPVAPANAKRLGVMVSCGLSERLNTVPEPEL